MFKESIKNGLAKIFEQLRDQLQLRGMCHGNLEKSYKWLESETEKQSLGLLHKYQTHKKYCDLDFEE